MRPIRIEVKGFGAFREPTEIDFEGAELFALLGPTGSGKSTVIDAVCFALYGSVPRYGHKGSVAPIVTMGAQEARVSLTFEVARRRYVATRVVRRDKTGAKTKEARLEEVDGEVLAGSGRELDDKVEELLGLTFDHFTRAVVLPQNEFARFLHDTPAARQELLISLLGFDVYERMMRRARAVAAEQEAAVANAVQRIEVLADCTSEKAEIEAEWVTEYGVLLREVRDVRKPLTEIERKVEAATDAAAREREIIARLKAVKVPSAVARSARDRDKAVALIAAKADVQSAAAAAEKAAQEALASLGARDPLLAARTAWRELEQAHTTLEPARQKAQGAEAEVEPAAAAVADAEQHVEALQIEHAAHALVGALVVGEPCPVCDQPVAKLPEHRAPATLTSATKTRDAARIAERKAREAAASARQSVTEIEHRVDALTAQLAHQPEPKEIERRVDAIDAATDALATARKANDAARADETKARNALAQIDQELQQAAAAFRAQRDGLVGVGVEPPVEQGELAADWPALAAWAKEEGPAHTAAATAADTRAKELVRERETRLGALVARAIELDVVVPKGCGVEDLGQVVFEAEHAAKAELARLKEGISERDRLERETRAAASEIHVARELAQLLDAKHFERWLVVEAVELLVVGASERLRMLTNNQYSLASDESSRDLLVIDHRNADERRSVRTLSGGETFQASLALALALADQLVDLAADGAARLESIFLDEGFGSLDPDTLETVAATIESLGAGERTVGVVTHVRELAERMPVQYLVTKGPSTANVVRVRTADLVKFRVDPWSVEYGASVESDLAPSEVDVNPEVERPAAEWTEIGPSADAREPASVLFVDGVRRVDARVWIEGDDGDVQPGICASFGAGVARCGPGLRADVIHPNVGRGVFSASAHATDIVTAHGDYAAHTATGANPEALWLALQERMARREVEAAEAARRECPDPGDALVVVDGPLSGRQHVAGAVGVIKTHGVAYLPPDLHQLVGRLRPGARTPLFTIGGRWSRHSWYLRLPGGVDAPWAGVVRVERSTDRSVAEAIGLAGTVGVTLCRYASEPYKDPRAPQNLYPIGGLERELRRRLGDTRLLFRALRVAAGTVSG